MSVPTEPGPEIREMLVLRSGGDDLERVYPWFEAIAARLTLPSKAVFRIQVVLEEATTNAALHGYEPEEAGNVALNVVGTRERVVAVLRDNGRAFNPLLEAPAPPTLRPIEDAVVGGLGIQLMRKLCSELTYRRDGDINELTMGFDVNTMAAA